MAEHQVAVNDIFLQPGHVYLPGRPALLSAVVASGVVVTLFDKALRRGGMGHYVRPYRQGNASTALYACPAIVSLVDMCLAGGSGIENLEAGLYGGAVNRENVRYVEGLSESNVRVGIEILNKLGVGVGGMDVGGAYGRKIVFNASTGEAFVARVEHVRATDWYV